MSPSSKKIKIGLISDTHGYLDPRIYQYFEHVDEIWHAGDIGNIELLQELQDFKNTKSVYGNIDDLRLQQLLPEVYVEDIEGLKMMMIHIAGQPPRYAKGIKALLKEHQPDVLICGHSHILKIQRDSQANLIYINPGAAGKQGFHKKRTLIRCSIQAGRLQEMEVIELGLRGKA
jgi:putative phosphoesterase